MQCRSNVWVLMAALLVIIFMTCPLMCSYQPVKKAQETIHERIITNQLGDEGRK